jgi:hypothetical protein
VNEITKFRGRRAELEMSIKTLEVRAAGLVRSMRNNLDPTVPVHTLPGDIIASEGVQLGNVLVDLDAARRELAQVRDLLGE